MKLVRRVSYEDTRSPTVTYIHTAGRVSDLVRVPQLCSLVKYTSFVLYWIYDPTKIAVNYLLFDVWMQRNINYKQIQILYNFSNCLTSNIDILNI